MPAKKINFIAHGRREWASLKGPTCLILKKTKTCLVNSRFCFHLLSGCTIQIYYINCLHNAQPLFSLVLSIMQPRHYLFNVIILSFPPRAPVSAPRLTYTLFIRLLVTPQRRNPVFRIARPGPPLTAAVRALPEAVFLVKLERHVAKDTFEGEGDLVLGLVGFLAQIFPPPFQLPFWPPFQLPFHLPYKSPYIINRLTYLVIFRMTR